MSFGVGQLNEETMEKVERKTHCLLVREIERRIPGKREAKEEGGREGRGQLQSSSA